MKQLKILKRKYTIVKLLHILPVNLESATVLAMPKKNSRNSLKATTRKCFEIFERFRLSTVILILL